MQKHSKSREMCVPNKAIDRCIEIANEAKNNKAIGRYNGWGLIWYNDADVYEWIRRDYTSAKAELETHNIMLLRWSSLSGEHDDYNDFAVRVGLHSP